MAVESTAAKGGPVGELETLNIQCAASIIVIVVPRQLSLDLDRKTADSTPTALKMRPQERRREPVFTSVEPGGYPQAREMSRLVETRAAGDIFRSAYALNQHRWAIMEFSCYSPEA